MVEFSTIQQLLSTACPYDPEEITMDKNLVSDLEIDSFGLMEMVISFEKEFHIEVPDRDLRLLLTVADIVHYIEEKQEHPVLAQA